MGKSTAPPTEITYTKVGDYLLPNITLNEPPNAEPLTKYGFMRKYYLQDHRPVLCRQMLMSEELYPHCHEVQRQAENRLKFMMEQMVKSNPPPDKGTDPLGWAAHMNMLKHSVEEVIFAELIYE